MRENLTSAKMSAAFDGGSWKKRIDRDFEDWNDRNSGKRRA